MKRILQLLGLLLTFMSLSTASAQTSVGLYGGLSMISLSGDSPELTGYSGNGGYSFGLSGEIGITKDIKLMLQPNYSSYGTMIGYDIGEEELKDSLELDVSYYRLPVLAKFEALNDYTYFISGLDFGYLNDAKYTDVNQTIEEKDISDSFQEFDLAAVFGAGVKIPVSYFIASAEVRYSQSLLNLSSNVPEVQFNSLPSRFRFSGFQIIANLSYKF
ncbi:MAG: PorT family protein [Ignavibacteria bacterium]|nr:PorT family protein [Ignavibacteria bacterium]